MSAGTFCEHDTRLVSQECETNVSGRLKAAKLQIKFGEKILDSKH